MSITAGEIDEMLTTFVVENDALLEQAAKDEKDVYDVVMNTLTLLSNRFGQGALANLDKKEPAAPAIKQTKPRTSKKRVYPEDFTVYEFKEMNFFAVKIGEKGKDIQFAGLKPNTTPNLTDWSIDGGSFYAGALAKTSFEKKYDDKKIAKVGYLGDVVKGNIYKYTKYTGHDKADVYFMVIADVDLDEPTSQVKAYVYGTEKKYPFPVISLPKIIKYDIDAAGYCPLIWDFASSDNVVTIKFNEQPAAYYVGCIFFMTLANSDKRLCVYKYFDSKQVYFDIYDTNAKEWKEEKHDIIAFIGLLTDSTISEPLGSADSWIADFIRGKKINLDKKDITELSLPIKEQVLDGGLTWQPRLKEITQQVTPAAPAVKVLLSAPEEEVMTEADIKEAIKALKPLAGLDPEVDASILALKEQLKQVKNKKS